jgi:hypothetical protein
MYSRSFGPEQIVVVRDLSNGGGNEIKLAPMPGQVLFGTID